MLHNNVRRITVLQARIDAIREIVAATSSKDLRGILLEMLEDGERALAQLASQAAVPLEGIDEAVGGVRDAEPPAEPTVEPSGHQGAA